MITFNKHDVCYTHKKTDIFYKVELWIFLNWLILPFIWQWKEIAWTKISVWIFNKNIVPQVSDTTSYTGTKVRQVQDGSTGINESTYNSICSCFHLFHFRGWVQIKAFWEKCWLAFECNNFWIERFTLFYRKNL